MGLGWTGAWAGVEWVGVCGVSKGWSRVVGWELMHGGILAPQSESHLSTCLNLGMISSALLDSWANLARVMNVSYRESELGSNAW